MIQRALPELDLLPLNLLLVENVGNLICPAAFALGTHFNVVISSVAEGDDKPAKYPAIFVKSKVLLINKIDLLKVPGQIDFDIEKVKSDTRRLNPGIHIFPVSAKTGEGIDAWCDWLKHMVARC